MGGMPQTGMVRTADQMDGTPSELPPAKRQRVAKLPGGQYYPEADWINMHPVRFIYFTGDLTFVLTWRF